MKIELNMRHKLIRTLVENMRRTGAKFSKIRIDACCFASSALISSLYKKVRTRRRVKFVFFCSLRFKSPKFFLMLRSSHLSKSMGVNISKDQKSQMQKNRMIEAEMKQQFDAEKKIIKMLLLGNLHLRVYIGKFCNCL